MLTTGDKIPTRIKVLDEKGKKVTLKKYLKGPLVLYFYPHDMTSGCITEAKDFHKYQKEFEKLGYKIVGVSPDDVESHHEFKKKVGFKFDLLSDPEKKLHNAFGIWQEKRLFGKTYMGTVRSTYVINVDGKIEKAWHRIKPKDHAKRVLAFVKKLSEKK